MKVLIACEESQTVCVAFRNRGHEAYSCDIQTPTGQHPEWHILGDVLQVIENPQYVTTMDGQVHSIGVWDMIIAHPPCTYMTKAGACRMYPHKGVVDPKRYELAMEAREFFMKIYELDCPRIAIENPVPMKIIQLPKHTQQIQPYEYGHPYTKQTYLWLKGLPKLVPTDIVKPIGPYICGNSETWKKQAAKGEVIGKEKSTKHRSKTFEGIADAMAEQWGTL